MMQTPVTSTFSSPPPLLTGSHPPASLSSGKGTLATALADRQNEIARIELVELPNELLALIMQKINDTGNPLELSVTCQSFKNLYHSIFKTHERQYHTLVYNMNTAALRHILNSSLRTAVPVPHTDAWQSLQAHPLAGEMTEEKCQTALLQKAYITSWVLLLQPQIINNRARAAELMKVLIDIFPHITNAKNYTEALFEVGLTWETFAQLADCHLDRCIQLVAKHFPVRNFIKYGLFPYQFIVSQLPPTLGDPLELIQELNTTSTGSILLYIVGDRGHKLGTYQARHELLEMLFRRGCDINQTDQAGDTALTLALNNSCENKKETFEENLSILQALLQHPQIEVNARDKYGNSALDRAILSGNSAGVQALLWHPKIDINARDTLGNSALARAAAYGNLAFVQALLQHPKIDINTKNNYGKSALDYAIDRGNLAIVQALQQHLDAKELAINHVLLRETYG